MALNKTTCSHTDTHKMNAATIIKGNEDLGLMLKSCAIAVCATNDTFQVLSKFFTKREHLNCQRASRGINFMLKKTMIEKAERLDLSKNAHMCCPLKIEGGESYNLHLTRGDARKRLPFDVFHISIGINYESYCSKYVRTMLINPTSRVKENYNCMLLIEQEIYKALRAGAELCKVYEDVMSFVKTEFPHLLEHLDKEFGFALCSNFKDDAMIISSNSKHIAREHMIFAVNVMLSGLLEEETVYNLCLSNTVIVRSDKEARPLTLYHEELQNLVFEEENNDRLEDVFQWKRFKGA